MANAPSIGKHLAVLNLFREGDGSVQVTVASAQGATAEMLPAKANERIAPANYVDSLIVEAAKNIVARRPDLKPEPSDLAVAIGEHAFRAGFKAGQHYEYYKDNEGETAAILETEWGSYDPPEELKGRDFQ